MIKIVIMYVFILVNKNLQIKKANLVSRVLYPLAVSKRISIIYLAPQSLTGSINLPITNPDKSGEDEQSSDFVTYLVFQHTRFTVMYVTIQDRELLPHVFTLITPVGARYIFCGTFCFRSIGPFPLGSVLLYVARTFLFSTSNGRTAIEPVCFNTKLIILWRLST